MEFDSLGEAAAYLGEDPVVSDLIVLENKHAGGVKKHVRRVS